jgi:methionine biosynthesis protein MetW
MDPKSFYQGLWSTKTGPQGRPVVQRDWLHRYLLDPVFDPRANTRTSVALALLPGGERLLDIGCWNGAFLEQVRSAGRYRELYGVDIVPAAVEATNAKGFPAQVVDLNGELLPFPDQCFDTVTILGVLEHVFDPYTVIREIYRVLRPGGTMLIDVPNVGSFTNRLRILFGRIPVTSSDPGWDGGHLHYFTKQALDRFLRNERFDIISRKTTGGRPELREWWISLLSGEFVYVCRRR